MVDQGPLCARPGATPSMLSYQRHGRRGTVQGVVICSPTHLTFVTGAWVVATKSGKKLAREVSEAHGFAPTHQYLLSRTVCKGDKSGLAFRHENTIKWILTKAVTFKAFPQ